MVSLTISTILLCVGVIGMVYGVGFEDLPPGDYCRNLQPRTCCDHREDDCHFDLNKISINTKCYCDKFCHRPQQPDNGDCCRDYFEVCQGVVHPTPAPPRPQVGDCPIPFTTERANIGDRRKVYCKTCECTHFGWEHCDPRVECLMDDDLLQKLQASGSRTGTGYKIYQKFGELTAREGGILRTGTYITEEEQQHYRFDNVGIPEQYDPLETRDPPDISRFYHVARDQGDCAVDWAYTLALGLSDRHAKQHIEGVAESLISIDSFMDCHSLADKSALCTAKDNFLSVASIATEGIVMEKCDGYQGERSVGNTDPRRRRCPVANTLDCVNYRKATKIIKSTRAQKVRALEDFSGIKAGIVKTGTLIGIMKVHRQFFYYSDGIYTYDHTIDPDDPLIDERDVNYHTVRLVGYGRTQDGVDYWVVSNTWGEDWGINTNGILGGGFVKIRMGQNALGLEDNIWIMETSEIKKKRRRHHHRRSQLNYRHF